MYIYIYIYIYVYIYIYIYISEGFRLGPLLARPLADVPRVLRDTHGLPGGREICFPDKSISNICNFQIKKYM